MAMAAHAAGSDSGAPALLSQTRMISVPEGTWPYRDPGRLLAPLIGVDPAEIHTVVGAVGVTQEAVIAQLWDRIGRGELDVGLIVGGEARARVAAAKSAGVALEEREQPEGCVPDETLSPHSLGIADLELVRNLVTPTVAYAVMDQARRHQLGRTPDQQRELTGTRYAAMSRVAALRSESWDRRTYTPSEIVDVGPDNRMVAWPYTKRLCSQWNVDQSAALLMCSYATALAAGVSPERMVFPRSSAVSDHAVPVLQRPSIGESPNADAALRAALAAAGLAASDECSVVDLYSCFPVALDVLASTLGRSDADGLTVTGGMSFAGGPLNNYVLGAVAALARLLRDDPNAFGLSTSVSGFLTKVGAGIWSASPPPSVVHPLDVTEQTRAATEADEWPIDDAYVGDAEVVGWTVEHLAGAPHRVVVVLDAPTGGRTMASSGDPEICSAMLEGEWIGVSVGVRADGSFSLGD